MGARQNQEDSVNKQYEALVLADALEHDKWLVPAVVLQESADELRRLHAVNAELLEAMKRIRQTACSVKDAQEKLDAAIKNAEAANG